MSGVEVVGLVLGIFPAVTQTVNMYKAVKSGRTVESLLRKLKTEKIIYNEFVRNLVSSEVTDSELQKLLAPAPNMLAWKDPELQAKLEKKLGAEKAENISEAVRDIGKLLKELNGELTDIPRGIEMLDKMTQRVKSKAKTAKNSFLQGSISARLKQLSELNADLARLLKSGRASHRVEKEEVTILRSEFLHRDIIEPKELFETICQSYTCNCDGPHVANLGFHCPCCHRPSGMPQSKKHEWKFELVFPPSSVVRGRRSTVGETISMVSSTDKKQPRLGLARSRSVSLSLESRPIQGDKTPLVGNLCTLVEKVEDESMPSQVLGMIGRKNTGYTLCVNHSNSVNAENMVCLEKLLDPSSRDELLRRERMLLAFGLSKAVLQFSSTPWLDASWSWKDFSVLSHEEGEHRELSHLFVQRMFYSALVTAKADKPSSLAAQIPTICGEPILTRLGFALIELLLGCSLCEFREKEPSSPNNTGTGVERDPVLDLSTAFNLLASGRIARLECQTYEDVVRACLYYQYPDPRQRTAIKGLCSKDPSFFDNVEESIIKPLYDACLHSGWEFPQAAMVY